MIKENFMTIDERMKLEREMWAKFLVSGGDSTLATTSYVEES